MSNPTNLTELADSLAASAEMALNRASLSSVPAYENGYRQALLDTRATVLAMIEDVNRRIRANNRVTGRPGVVDEPDEADLTYQAILDGRIEAYEDVRGGGES